MPCLLYAPKFLLCGQAERRLRAAILSFPERVALAGRCPGPLPAFAVPPNLPPACHLPRCTPLLGRTTHHLRATLPAFAAGSGACFGSLRALGSG